MTKEAREYIEDKLDALLKAFMEDLAELEFKVEDAGWESGMENERDIMDLRLRLDGLAHEVQRLKTADDQSWQVTRRDVENALEEFGLSLKKEVSRWEKVLPE